MKPKLITLSEHTVVSVKEDTQFVLDCANYVADREYYFEALFEKEGVSAEILSAHNLRTGTVLNLTTIAHHKVAHTSCVISVKSVLDDNAQFSFVGKIIIDKNAQQTSSFLNDNILVVGDATKSNSQPILQIDANDVSASHAATTGRVDASQVFYLTSRGLSLREAEALIIEGFFTSVLNKIPAGNVREKLAERVK